LNLGVRRPLRYEPVPIAAGDYDDAVHVDHPEAPSILANYLDTQRSPDPTQPTEERLTFTPGRLNRREYNQAYLRRLAPVKYLPVRSVWITPI
jgi:hypothetical protein